MNELTRHYTPPDLITAAQKVTRGLLPAKSGPKYNKVYDKFVIWQKSNKTISFSENVMLAYFDNLSKSLSSATLWSQYSMLKTTIMIHHNIDIKNYSKLLTFLKKTGVGYKSKKANTLTSEQVEKFLKEAPDTIHLATKAILVVGVSGACRRKEICNLTMNNLKEVDASTILVQLEFTKTNITRSFTISGGFCEILQKYISSRPKGDACNRLFLKYTNGQCYNQPIGINKIGSIPKVIAEYLKLPNPERYTGHTFRRTSATLLADAGADLTTLKRHGGWKSNSVTESYIDDSLKNKLKIANQINQNINLDKENRPTTAKIDDANSNNDVKNEPEINPVQNASVMLSQVKNKTVDESVDLSSIINMPSKNMNFTFNNCTVNFHFDGKQ